MKPIKQPRNPILRENLSDTPSLNPNLMKPNRPISNRKQKASKENAPPSDMNVIVESKPLPSVGKLKSVLPPRPPNPLKRKIGTDFHPENGACGSTDTGVKVYAYFIKSLFSVFVAF